MTITAFLQRCDGKTVKVLAGDLGEGFWEFDGRTMSRMTPSGKREECLLEGHLKRLELHRQLEKDAYEPLLGAGMGAMIGFAFGPLGAVAGGVIGHAMTNHNAEISVTIDLDDGRGFMAVMVPQLFYRMKGLVAK